MITKKDFIAIVKILNSNLYQSDGEYRGDLFTDLVEFFKSVNPKFDEVKFREAVYNKK